MTYYARGAYKAEIVAQGLGESSTGNPQFWLQVRILECLEPAAQPVEQYDRTIFWSITEGTVEFVCEKLKRLGFTGDKFSQLDPNDPACQSFVGQEVELFCKLETYEGKEREKWDLSRGAPSGPNVTPLDATAARKLDTLFGRKLKEAMRGTAPKANGTAVKVAEPVAAAPVNDDGIPF